jgi:hypothetical protein
MSATVFYADPASELATLQNIFKVNGTPTDATTVTLTVTDPTGTATVYSSTTHVSTGTYQQNVPATLDGIWVYKWVGTGTATDVQEGTFTVGPSALNQNYCSVEELKSRLGITDTSDDFEVSLAVAGASRSIDEICGRYFWRGTDTRTYVPETWFRQNLDDLVSVTTFKVDRDGDGVFEETWTQGTDYALEVAPARYNTTAKGETWPYTAAQVITGGRLLPFVWLWSHLDRVQVVGTFGWPAVPIAVKNATLIAAADLFRLKDAPFGVAGFGEFGAVKITANPRVMSLLKRYINGNRVGV